MHLPACDDAGDELGGGDHVVEAKRDQAVVANLGGEGVRGGGRGEVGVRAKT